MSKLADIAQIEATKCFHGYVMGTGSNIDELVKPFPKWTKEEADGKWCAAFVYYCCNKAGFNIPIRPAECKTCHLAGCVAWEEWAKADERIKYYTVKSNVEPKKGDIVLFDRVFNNSEHDHIGIVIDVMEDSIVVAEGNFNNVSGIVRRKRDEHIRSFIRIPAKFAYEE